MAQKIFNTLLIIIFAILVMLFAYKNLNKPQAVSIPVVETKDSYPNSNPSYSKEEIQKIIKDYIIQNPQDIISSLEKMKQDKIDNDTKKTSDYIQNNKSMIEEDGTPPIMGNKNGDISIVMFYDYNCSFCRKANLFNIQLLESDPNVKIILRPVGMLGKTSDMAAKLALAIYKISEKKFIDFHNELFTITPLKEDAIKALVKKYDLDYDLVLNEMNSMNIQDMTNKNLNLTQNLDIRGAPSYLINGHLVSGLVDNHKLADIIKHIRDSSKNETLTETTQDDSDSNNSSDKVSQ